MLRKLTDEKLSEILECGISEFALKGINNASMSSIASRASISVGVLYKYYRDKNEFFLACVQRSLTALEDCLSGLSDGCSDPAEYAGRLIAAAQSFCRRHPDYVRMYNVITGAEADASALASEIETGTSSAYRRIFLEAAEKGLVRSDISPELMAFFFDNLLMMMHYSYCCPYYIERFRIYCGDEVSSDDGAVAGALQAFLSKAFAP